jgi:23S rRNA pseudouridine1911/1915/1917 synthase
MPDQSETFQFFADRGDSRLRLDQVLVRRVTAVTHMSRSVAQRWIEAGVVTVDGRVARRSSDRVREQAAIHVALPPDTILRSVPEPEPGALEILYEDDWLIAVNKPPGVVVHPSYKQLSGTLLNTVLWHVRARSDARPGILTRLDKDTSGIVVVACTGSVHASMQRDAAAGRVRKEYLAIVHGSPHPASGVIRDPLGRDPGDRRRVVVSPGGAASETRYEVIRSLPEDLSLVRCELVTGRTHQIRVHLSSHGWPIAGDRLYGAPSTSLRAGRTDQMTRQALHASRITLPHPVTRERLVLRAPLPADWPYPNNSNDSNEF